MVRWHTLPTFATDDIVRVDTFQDIKENMEYLKDPMSVSQNLPGDGTLAYTATGTGSFVDVDATYYQLAFESYGNDVLIVANMRYSHSAASGEAAFTFEVDGVQLGGTNGLGSRLDIPNVQETLQLVYIKSLTEGAHTASLMVKNITVGTAEVWKDSCLNFWVFEF